MAHQVNPGNAVRLRDESLETIATSGSSPHGQFNGSIGKDNMGGCILIKRNLKKRRELLHIEKCSARFVRHLELTDSETHGGISSGGVWDVNSLQIKPKKNTRKRY